MRAGGRGASEGSKAGFGSGAQTLLGEGQVEDGFEFGVRAIAVANPIECRAQHQGSHLQASALFSRQRPNTTGGFPQSRFVEFGDRNAGQHRQSAGHPCDVVVPGRRGYFVEGGDGCLLVAVIGELSGEPECCADVVPFGPPDGAVVLLGEAAPLVRVVALPVLENQFCRRCQRQLGAASPGSAVRTVSK